jgi:hypothetical protein
MTVNEAFENFKSKLELPDRRQAEAAAAQQAVREKISAHLYIRHSFLSGSYSRHTKIHPLNDIDVFLIRNDARVGLSTDGSGVFPSTALAQVADAVQKAYPSATIKIQGRSVNVEIPGLAFGFDLVPAWYRSPNGYWIPNADAGTWIPTDPEQHARMLTEANERCNKRLIPLVKMAKHWSRHNLDLFRSFHVELICQRILVKPIDGWQVGMATVLVQLAGFVGKPMMDPVYGVSRIDKELSAEEQTTLFNRIQSDAGNAIEALKLEAAGDDAKAIEKWRYIFLSGF